METKEEGETSNGDAVEVGEKTKRVSARVKAFISGLDKTVTSEKEEVSSESDEEKDAEQTEDICRCKFDCLAQFKTRQVNKHRKKIIEWDKVKREKYIMRCLQKFKKEKTTPGKRKRDRYRYTFETKPICKQVFCFLHNIGNKCLKNLQKHLTIHGVVPRIHGNKGRKPSHALNFDKAHHAVDWLEKFAEANGLTMSEPPRQGQNAEAPGSKKANYDERPIMLPTHVSKKGLHRQYQANCTENNLKPLGLTSFKNVWQHCAPHIQMKPREIDPNRKPRPPRRRKKKTDGAPTVERTEDVPKRERPTDYLQEMQGQQRLAPPMPTMSPGFTQDFQRRERQEQLNTVRKVVEEMKGQRRQAGPYPPMPTDFTMDGQRREEMHMHQRQDGPMPPMLPDFAMDSQRREWQDYLNSMRKAEEEMQSQQRQPAPIPTMPIDFTQVHYPFDGMQNVSMQHHNQQMSRNTIPHHSQQMGSCMMLSPDNTRFSAPDWTRQNNTPTS